MYEESFFLRIRRPPRSTPFYSSAASNVYKRQATPMQHTLLPRKQMGPIPIGPVDPPPARSNNMQMAPPIATGVVGHMELSTPAMVSSRFRFWGANSGQSGPFHHGTACQSLQN